MTSPHLDRQPTRKPDPNRRNHGTNGARPGPGGRPDPAGHRERTGSPAGPVLLVVAVAALLTACGGASTDPQVAHVQGTGAATTSGAADPQAQQQRWAACMSAAGVPMVRTVEGNYQVNKQKVGLARIEAATQRCLHLQPAASPSRAPLAADLERSRQLSACLRGHGVPDYPDPDPATGQAPLTDAQARDLKSSATFRTAMEACRSSAGTPTGQLGG